MAEPENHESARPSEPEVIPSATFDFLGFESMTLAEFGSEAARRLVRRPLETLTIFSDARTGLPGLFMIFGGGIPTAEGLLLSPRPTSVHPFAELGAVIASGATLDQIKYTREPVAEQPSPDPDHAWAQRLDHVGQLRGISLNLCAAAAALEDGEPLSQERRQELADLLKPVIKTFEGAIASELARQSEEPR